MVCCTCDMFHERIVLYNKNEESLMILLNITGTLTLSNVITEIASLAFNQLLIWFALPSRRRLSRHCTRHVAEKCPLLPQVLHCWLMAGHRSFW